MKVAISIPVYNLWRKTPLNVEIMSRVVIKEPGETLVKTTVWLPQNLRDVCRRERLGISGLASRGLRKELEQLGVMLE